MELEQKTSKRKTFIARSLRKHAPSVGTYNIFDKANETNTSET